MMVGWQPTPEQVAEEVANYQGAWSDQGRSRVKAAVGMHTETFIFFIFWRVSGLMIVGCGGDPYDADAIDPIADASDANNKPTSVFDTIDSKSG